MGKFTNSPGYFLFYIIIKFQIIAGILSACKKKSCQTSKTFSSHRSNRSFPANCPPPQIRSMLKLAAIASQPVFQGAFYDTAINHISRNPIATFHENPSIVHLQCEIISFHRMSRTITSIFLKPIRLEPGSMTFHFLYFNFYSIQILLSMTNGHHSFGLATCIFN